MRLNELVFPKVCGQVCPLGIRFSMICYDISIVVWACLLKKCDSKRMSKQTVLQRLSPPFYIQTLLHSEFAEIVPFPFITTCHLPPFTPTMLSSWDSSST